MNTLLNNLKNETNYTYTENMALIHKTSMSWLLDLFGMGAAYRKRTDEDCIYLFMKAFREDPTYALKCLFYLRDVRGGQGERRFFRVVCKYLAAKETEAMKRNLQYVPEYGRYDDWYVFIGTPLEKSMFELMKSQLAADMQSYDKSSKEAISLLAKWLKSENTSSLESRSLANKTRIAFGMTHKQYRKTLSILRERIKVLERLMSANRWDEIEFDKIPSKAGLVYRNAFARRDIIAKKYEAFAKNTSTKVNAEALYPHDVAHKAFDPDMRRRALDAPERLMLQKYWDNLKDFYNGREENGIAVVDVSGSMVGTPMEAAVSMGAYIADKAHGPFAHHFITFSMKPELVGFEGVDIVDKLNRCKSANWDMNTNIKAVFDMLLSVAKNNRVKVEDMPTRLYIFSDMEFDRCVTFSNKRVAYGYWDYAETVNSIDEVNSDLEKIKREWAREGYKMPQVVFWNLNARNDRIPAIGEGFSYVSGFSPSMIDTILSGKDGYDLMLEKLLSDRYAAVVA